MNTQNSFLRETAQDLYSRFGKDISKVKILFPSRRARLFFLDALSEMVNEPIWQPQWVSIDDIMCEISGLQMGERVRLIAELYKVYKKYHRNENFDKFFFYGEMLLADFDMVDKYQVDARQLFSNLADIKELETDLSYMTEKQLQILAFWSSIKCDGEMSKHKLRFLEVWQSLFNIYTDFRARLEELGIAYAGMIHRKAAQKIEKNEYQFDASQIYAVVGFNALSQCEKSLLRALKTSCTAHFYWDYDNYYTQGGEQEAGLFIGENIKLFPAACATSHDNMASDKAIESVGCSSSTLQCRYASQIIERIARETGGTLDKKTAIILTDESLLLPLLYALPKQAGEVNVTMGYPLMQTLAYSLLERLLKLQQNSRKQRNTEIKAEQANFYHADVVGLLNHPYIEANIDAKVKRRIEREINERRLIRVSEELFHDESTLKLIFRHINNFKELAPQLFAVIQALSQKSIDEPLYGKQSIGFLDYIGDQIMLLHNNIMQCEIEMSLSLMISLLRRHLQSLRIPFEGEPLKGLQVMGILETRTLDFDNVIILSMNDDNFPGNRLMQPSYIPYNLRMAHDLPTPEHHEGVYAYYFYRLIQRAKNVWMLYCSRADDKSTGERSRYITQLDFESHYNLRHRSVGVDVVLRESKEIVIEKKGRVAEQLSLFLSEGEHKRRLSPTMLFNYVACPLRFYYKAIALIKEQEEMEDEVDAPMFGNILHDAMQRLLEPIIGVSSASTQELLSRISEGAIDRAVVEAINSKSLRREGTGLESQYSGDLLLVREIVGRYIRAGILRFDIANPNFSISSVESEVSYRLELPSLGSLHLWGLCDRVDDLDNGTRRIVDYKTGALHLEFAGLEALFNGEGKHRQSNVFQALLYSYIYHKIDSQRTIQPALYYVRKMQDEIYSPLLVDCSTPRERTPIESYGALHEAFEGLLHSMLYEIFDFETPFVQCEDKAHTCEYCAYRSLCNI